MLTGYADGRNVAGRKLKEAGTIHGMVIIRATAYAA
jgi:hypothetical protein